MASSERKVIQRKISTLLIANRGEIACRIIRTCKRLGIRSVAVYSEADKDALHTKLADEAHLIGGPEATDSYLNQIAIINAACKSKADAVHPGYGFLSENASFADALQMEDILFVGPSSAAISLMGDKIRAKELAKKAKVPTVPGMAWDTTKPKGKGAKKKIEDTSGVLKKIAAFGKKVGFPLLIKAASGGGGRGMRLVHNESELKGAIESASREAEKFFADGRVFIEKAIEEPRHIEVQLFGDKHRNVLHLFDRDCTAQRNYQKVIEEAPASALPPAVRKKILAAAVQLGKLSGYYNAGTVEFLVDRKGNFYFLEVNSRLQVEHPVTEAITGLDLVELQIRIAEGASLKQLLPDEVEATGVAIECRLCAESPRERFISSTGVIRELRLPSGTDVRVDTGFSAGDTVTHYYDSLLAKLIVRAPTRETAIERMTSILHASRVLGVKTNLPFLLAILTSAEFRRMEHHIQFATTLLDGAAARAEQIDILHAALYVIHGLAPQGENNSNPWSSHDGWRLHSTAAIHRTMRVDSRDVSFELRIIGDDSYRVHVAAAKDASSDFEITVRDRSPLGFAYRTGPENGCAAVAHAGGTSWILTGHDCVEVREATATSSARAGHSAEKGSQAIVSPLPGKVIDVRIAAGTEVKKGDTVIVIESMKMEHPIKTLSDGTVHEVMVKKGSTVDANVILVRMQ